MMMDWFFFFYVMREYSQPIHSFSDIVRLLGLLIITSNNNAAQFAIAHEIFHKGGLRRVVGTLHMAKNLYMHFTYEHVFGHHRRVATPDDPATSKYNENSFHFVVRSYFGSYKSVYQQEQKAGKWFFNNYSVLSVVGSLAFCAIVFKYYGIQGLIFALIQAAGAILYLEVINYIEHYGLKRKLLPNGEYEKVTVKHSWNAPHRFSNYLLFKLQRHSDHHENSMKPYQTLLTLDESPQLPHGYIVMTLLAMFPDTFRRIMNPLVNGEEGNQNVEDLASKEATAVTETRKFIMKMSICVTTAMFFSYMWIK
jgi:alkane 1-monooxygenase